jgi:RNA polymerase sigma factor (TIGR02999 family)
MSDSEKSEYEDRIRGLLAAVRGGNRDAFAALIGAVGHEMRKLSAFHMRQQPQGVTLQTTALVNEAVLRLIQMLNSKNASFPETKQHFMALVSQMMRFTLTDYARKRRLKTVSLDEPRETLDSASHEPLSAVLESWSDGELDDLLAVDEALTTLERSDVDYGKRRTAALELYLFGGFNYREIADELGVTDDMARRDCQTALAQLRRLLDTPSATGASSATT